MKKFGIITVMAGILMLMFLRTASATVVISEFFANPSGTDTGHEFVELYNSGAGPVDLTGWILSDEDSDTFTLPSVSIGTGAFVILAADRATFIGDWSIPAALQSSVVEASFTLTNTGDEVVIENSSPALMWSLAYGGGIEDGGSAYLDPSVSLVPGASFGDKAAPGVDLGASGDYMNQGFSAEPEAWTTAVGTASPFAWNGVTQVPEPSTGLLCVLAGLWIIAVCRCRSHFP